MFCPVLLAQFTQTTLASWPFLVWASVLAPWLRICLQCCRRHRFDPLVRKIPWRRKWQHPAVFLPGKFHGQRSLASHSLWGCRVGLHLVTKPPPPFIYLARGPFHLFIPLPGILFSELLTQGISLSLYNLSSNVTPSKRLSCLISTCHGIHMPQPSLHPQHTSSSPYRLSPPDILYIFLNICVFSSSLPTRMKIPCDQGFFYFHITLLS